MVKARLSQPVPMAELLKVLSQWKQQPASAPEAGSTAQMAPAPAAEPTLLQLAERLERLEQKVDRLTDLLLQQGSSEPCTSLNSALSAIATPRWARPSGPSSTTSTCCAIRARSSVREFPTSMHEGYFVSRVVCPEQDSLHPDNQSEQVKLAEQQLNQAGLLAPNSSCRGGSALRQHRPLRS